MNCSAFVNRRYAGYNELYKTNTSRYKAEQKKYLSMVVRFDESTSELSGVYLVPPTRTKSKNIHLGGIAILSDTLWTVCSASNCGRGTLLGYNTTMASSTGLGFGTPFADLSSFPSASVHSHSTRPSFSNN